MNLARSLAAGSLLALVAGLSAAQGISAVRVDNRSRADVANVSTTSGGQLAIAHEFSSGAAVRAPRTQGDVSDFAVHMNWFGGYRLGPGLGPAAVKPPPREANLEYAFTFKVEDPLRQGYTLQVESFVQGLLYALAWGPGASATAYLPKFVVELDVGGTYFGPHTYDIDGASLTWNPASLDRPRRREDLRTTEFWGDRTFSLRVSTPVDTLLDAGPGLAPALPDAETYALFGRLPTRNELATAAGLLPSGVSADELGHFMTVTARFNAPLAPVPEPATWASLALGIGALLWRRRVRTTL